MRPAACTRAFLTVLLLAAASSRAEPPAEEKRGSTQLEDLSELQSTRSESDPETWPGAPLYRQYCASCHEGAVPKAPHTMFLRMMTAGTILDALTHGLMAEQGKPMKPEARRQVAEYLAGAPLDSTRAPPPPLCRGGTATVDVAQPPVAVGWGHGNARFVPAAIASLPASDVPRLELQWAFEYPGAIRARSQPAIAWGAVYTGSHDGTVYAFDLASGCLRWSASASAEVRTAIVLDPDPKGPPRLYFGDVIARAYALDAHTGRRLWSVKVDDHPNATLTGSPTVHGDTLYVPVSSLEVTTAADPKYECCKFRGAIVALDTASGRIRWKTHTIRQEPRPVRTTSVGTRVLAPSGAPVWNSPTIDAKRGLLYVGTGENYSSPANETSDAILAFRLSDGALVWSRQMLANDAWNVACMMKNNPNCPPENGPDVDFGAGTILVTLPGGKDVLLAGQKNGVVYALDPDDRGALLWKRKVGRGGIQGGVHFGMAIEGTKVFAPIADLADGRDGRTYDSPPRPGLYALDAADGALLWSTPAKDVCGGRQYCDPGISAAVTAIPGIVFAGHMDGWLRAYDSGSGKVVWEFDSNQSVSTVSGTRAHGGSFGGAGAAVRDGYVAVNSGYGLYFHMPGKVLLVFARASTK